MTLDLSDNKWAKALIVLAAIILFVTGWAYVAGGMFMATHGYKFDDATPISIYQYWKHYGHNANIKNWIYGCLAASFILLCSPIAILFAPAKRSLYGDARFATMAQIRKAGLLGERGIIAGKIGNWFTGFKYLIFSGSQHVITSAPTRGGKGVGLVIPNLLNWPDSVINTDMKLENWLATSKFRARHGQECYLFNPTATDYKTHRYNPLAYISTDPNFRIDDIQKIAHMFFPDMDGVDPIWTATPRSLFLGIVLFLMETEGKPVTLGQVLRETLADGDGAKYFAKAINAAAEAGKPYSNSCILALNTYITIKSENTRSGVISSFRSRLELWNNPLIDAATSGNDFDLRDLRRRRMSIYVGITPDNLGRLAPLINLFFQQAIDLNTRTLPEQDSSLKYQCLLLMDEFTAFGKIEALSKGISFVAGYGLRMMPIIQSPSQIVDTYGQYASETFNANHAMQIVFAPKATEIKVATDISEWLGYQTVKGVSESRGKNIFTRRERSESESDQRRALLLPQEIIGMGQEREIIVLENTPPILARKVRYFKEPIFMARLIGVSKTLQEHGRRVPKESVFKSAIRLGELAAKVPKIDVTSHIKGISINAPKTVEVPDQEATKTIVERPVTVEDLPNLDKLALSDFAVDFSGVQAPDVSEVDEAALMAYADELCRSAGISI